MSFLPTGYGIGATQQGGLLSDGLAGLTQGGINSPLMGLGMGLLSQSGYQQVRPTLGQGIAAGLQGMQQNMLMQQQMKRQQMQDQILQMKMDEAKRQQEASERMSQLLQDPTKPYQASPDMLFPGEQAPEGWKQQMTPEEVRSGLLGNLAVLDPSATAKALLNPEVQSPYSDIGKLQADLAAGRITLEQYQMAMAIKSKPLVQMQMNQGPEPPKDYWWVDPNDPAKGARPIPGGPADPSVKTTPKRVEKYQDAMDTLGRVEQSLTNYEQQISTTGAEIMPGTQKAKLGASYRDLQLELKELYNLGVLNGPDLELMEQVLTDPTSITAKGYEAVGMVTGSNPLKDQLQIVRNKLNAARQRANDLYGQGAPNLGNVARPQSQADYDSLPSGAIFIDPDDGQTYRKP